MFVNRTHIRGHPCRNAIRQLTMRLNCNEMIVMQDVRGNATRSTRVGDGEEEEGGSNKEMGFG